jgi:hypothetical protein
MHSNDRDELDDVIDGALPGYSSADPMDGLEDRVLRRVQAAGAVRRSPWFCRLGFAIPALAAVLFACIALRIGWNPQPRSTSATPKPAVSKPSSLASAPQPSPPPATRVVEPKRGIGTGQGYSAPPRSLPKEEVFPAAVPSTDEERALVAWVRRAPAEAAQAFSDLKKRDTEPIQIPPIEIPPLQSDGAQ